MEVTLDKLLSGKATRINSKDFLSTEDYVKPFIEEMSKFTSTYRIEAIPPSQVTTDKEGEDITYNRVLVQAIMPTQIDEYNEIYTLAYSLDIRKPIYKVYRAMFNNTTNSIVVFDPNWLIVNEIKPTETFTLPITGLMGLTSDFEIKLKKYKNDTLSTKENDRYIRLGAWIEKCQFAVWQNDFGGKVKWSPTNVVKVYNNIYINTSSDYYVGDKDSSIINTYNSFAQLIADDKKDICNKFEKTMLINLLLGIK